jgi:hypothetical protein
LIIAVLKGFGLITNFRVIKVGMFLTRVVFSIAKERGIQKGIRGKPCTIPFSQIEW